MTSADPTVDHVLARAREKRRTPSPSAAPLVVVGVAFAVGFVLAKLIDR